MALSTCALLWILPLGIAGLLVPLERHQRSSLASTLKKFSENDQTLQGPPPQPLTPNDVNNTQAFYTGYVTLSEKPEEFELVFDTSSAWLWVRSSGSCNGYSPSSSYNSTGNQASVYFQGAKLSGFISSDWVGLGESPGYYPNQTFLLISGASSPCPNNNGVLGLGFNASSNRLPTFLDNLLANAAISRRTFAFSLNGNNYGNGGFVEFGEEILYSKHTKNLTISNTGFWDISLAGFAVSSTTHNTVSTFARFNSSTEYLQLPLSDYASLRQAIASVIEGSCSYIGTTYFCTCDNVADMPEITIISNKEQNFTLKPEMYASLFSESGVRSCQLLIEPCENTTFNGWVLGNIVMRGYFTQFDMDNMQVVLMPLTPTHSSKHLEWWVILLIVAGSVLLISAVAGGVTLYWRRRKRSKKTKGDLSSAGSSDCVCSQPLVLQSSVEDLASPSAPEEGLQNDLYPPLSESK